MSETEVELGPLAVELNQKLQGREARIGVIGLGYVGLPLAMELGRVGFKVVGIDVDRSRCEALNTGVSHVSYVASDLLSEFVAAGRFRAAVDAELTEDEIFDVLSICVPTPLRETRDPDLSFVIAAAETARRHLRRGMLVILESTTYPGTTEGLLRDILESGGLRAGADFFLAYSPERVDPGLPGSVLRPRVVGGLTPACSHLAEALYGTMIESVVPVSSPRAAEMTKILENTFRAVNIGLINELAQISDSLGIDVWEVIDAAATKPAGFMPFYPGPGLGGHCIPVDPFYLSWKVRELGLEARFIEVSGQVNNSMPRYVADKVVNALNAKRKAVRGASILVLGVAYKPDVDDIREAPALEVMALLRQKGAEVSYHDPYIRCIPAGSWHGGIDIESVPLTEEGLGRADCVVVLTAHSSIDFRLVASTAQLLVDACNAIQSHPLTAPLYKLGAPDPPS